LSKNIIILLIGFIVFLFGNEFKNDIYTMLGSAIVGGGLFPLLINFFIEIKKFFIKLIKFVKQLFNIFINKNINKLMELSISHDSSVKSPLLLIIDTEGVSTPKDRSNIEDFKDILIIREYLKEIKNISEMKVIFNSCRNQGYIEMLCQMLNIASDDYFNIPHIIENGSALYDSANKDTITLLTNEEDLKLRKLELELREIFKYNIFEPKNFMITLNPNKNETTFDLAQKINKYINQKNYDYFEINSSFTAVDIIIKNKNKSTALSKIIKDYFSNQNIINNIIIISSHDSDLELIKYHKIKKIYISNDTTRVITELINGGYTNIEKIKGEELTVLKKVLEIECGLTSIV